ncbi:MAG: ATP-dependent RNA helicase HrpA, partial [Planctomycetota bacterium]
GVCVRLYAADDFARRAEHTDPEILRSSLAGVILQMKVHRLGEVETFPFLDPPDRRAIRRGYAELLELGALDADRRLTDMGRRMARLATEPRYARMLLEAADRGALAEALTVVAALSIRDPRERPLDRRTAADHAHKPWRDESSDFLAYLHLWKALVEKRAELPSNNQFRRYCRKQFLSYVRVREWQRIRAQLADELQQTGARENTVPAPPETLHQSLLAGLLGRIGTVVEGREYRGAHNIRFAIHPGSGLRGRSPQWVMAAELVKTRRLYARTVAEIRPEWAERLAGDLVKRSYHSAHWEARTGHVRAYERVSLYGLPIIENRRVDYSRIEPAEARSLFLEKALVQGDVRTTIPTLAHNLAVVEDVRDLEHKARRRDLLVDSDSIYDFYDRRVPADVCNLPAFALWLHAEESTNPDVLRLRPEDVLLRTPRGLTEDRFPSTLDLPSGRFPLAYRFAPGEEDDGVTVRLPVGVLPHVAAWRFDWLAPGLLGEKLAHLLRSLPKRLRRPLVPIPQSVEACLEILEPGSAPLLDALVDVLRDRYRVDASPDDFRTDDLPAFLRMRFAVTDADDRILESGRDLAALRATFDRMAREQFDTAAKDRWQRDGLTAWDVGDLPERVELGVGGRRCYGYPALVDEGDSVALRLFEDPDRAAPSHRAGVRRLYALAPQARVKGLRKSMPIGQQAGMIFGSLGGSLEGLKDDVLLKAIDHVLLDGQPAIREPLTFERRIEGKRGPLNRAIHELSKSVDAILLDRQATAELFNATDLPDATRADIRSQLRNLAHPTFVLETPFERFADIPRYLKALRARIERARHSPHKDAKKLRRVAPLWEACLERLETARREDSYPPALIRYRWLLEEYRVSVFAQEVGAGEPVSEKRLAELWTEIPRG